MRNGKLLEILFRDILFVDVDKMFRAFLIVQVVIESGNPLDLLLISRDTSSRIKLLVLSRLYAVFSAFNVRIPCGQLRVSGLRRWIAPCYLYTFALELPSIRS